MSEEIVDLAVIGAGPTGMFAAYYAGFRGLSVALLDTLPVLGGQVTAMYPDKIIGDVAGFPAVPGRELVERLEAQLLPFDPRIMLGHRVQTLADKTLADKTLADKTDAADAAGETLVLTTDVGARVRARTVLVAGGVGSFAPRPLPPEAGLAESDVEHFVSSLSRYDGRHAVVVGGGDSALDWALMVREVAASVTLVHRRSTFRAHQHSIQQARDLGVRFITDAQLVGSQYDGGLRAVEIGHADGSRSVETCDAVIAALGFTARLGPILEWDLRIEQGRHVVVGSRMHTSRPRVFAAGDLCTYDGKVPLIAVGFGEAATAVNNACRVIDPAASLFGGHSTDAAAPAPVLQGAV